MCDKITSMNILIVGAGPAGVVSALAIKKAHPNYDVTILEHLEEPLKKVLATGNGKCNLGNAKLDWKRFSHYDFVSKHIYNYSFDGYREYLSSLNIRTKLIDNLLYPISESAITVREALLFEAERLGIRFKLGESISSYSLKDNFYEVKTNKSNLKVDKIIFSTGSKSSPQLGSDGSIYSLLSSHGYKIAELKPGLCPIHTVEKTRVLDGIRVKANVTLLKNGKKVHEEAGEVLFKDKGLSGIVIFNMMSEISRKGDGEYKLLIDLLPEFDVKTLQNLHKNQSNGEFLRGFVHPKMLKYFLENGYDAEPIRYLKDLPFTFDSPYGFEFSHVTVGGVELSEIKDNFESRKEPGVYFLGEVLDIDGPCGGYNLTWIFHSARNFNF